MGLSMTREKLQRTGCRDLRYACYQTTVYFVYKYNRIGVVFPFEAAHRERRFF